MTTCSVTGSTPNLSPSFLLAQAIFEPNLFLCDYLLCNRIHPYPVTLHPTGSGYFRAKPFSLWIPQHYSNIVILHLTAYEYGTECSETSAYKIQKPGNYTEESIQHSEYGESLKTRKDAGVISKHFHLSKWIILQWKIIDVYVKKKRTQDWALRNPMFTASPTRTKILCILRFQFSSLFPII
jgi:hypothetical protein